MTPLTVKVMPVGCYTGGQLAIYHHLRDLMQDNREEVISVPRPSIFKPNRQLETFWLAVDDLEAICRL